MTSVTTTSQLMTISPSGVASTTTLPNPAKGTVIPDGNGGALVQNFVPANQNQSQVSTQVIDAGGSNPTATISNFTGGDTVLGDQGTYFMTDGNHVVCVDEASGNEQWRWQPNSGTVQIVAATAGGGVAVKNIVGNQEDVVLLDATGTPTYDTWGTSGGSAGYGVVSNSSYYSHGLWFGTTGDPVIAGVIGDVMFDALGPWPFSGGGAPDQNSSPLPIFSNFEPVDPNPFGTSKQKILAKDFPRYKNKDLFAPLGTATTPHNFLKSSATLDAFENQIGKPIQAIAFIGHAYVPKDQAQGLCFWAQCGVPNLILPPGVTGITTQDNQGDTYDVVFAPPQLDVGARVVFISACDFATPAMQDFIGISSQTQHRALVLPTNVTDTYAYMGETEWLYIAQALAQHKTVQVAVDYANGQIAQIPWTDLNGNPLPLVKWHVVGDGSIKF